LAALFSSILHEEQNLSSRVAQIILLSHWFWVTLKLR
jgi:hypothetical protein